MFDDVPSTELPRAELAGEGCAVTDLLVAGGPGRVEGRGRAPVRQGGVYVNNRRVADERARVTAGQAIGGEVLVLRKGAARTTW